MDRRSYESPMEWEYQSHGPMDPSSPFAQSTKQAQGKNTFGSSSFGTFGQNNPFNRTHSTPSKPMPPSPAPPSSIFSSSRLQRTTTAPPFRNPAFTTPRKAFDADTLSEVSAAESSPTATDNSDFPDTPDNDHSYDLAHMTITPATMNRNKALFGKKASGKGEIPSTIFASRDKVRKRKRRNADKDISGYRLPYMQQDEWDDSDYESDESTFQPSKAHTGHKKRHKDGWFGNFMGVIQRHPQVPSILGYWLNFAFSLVSVIGSFWIIWAIIAGLREDFASARGAVRAEILDEIDKCRTDYRENRCQPIEQRLPAMYELCETWFACMNQNPDNVKNVQLGAKSIVEIINEIVDTMSYKTIALFVLLFAIFVFSGRSLYKTAHGLPDFSGPAPPAYGHQQVGDPHMLPPPQQIYWQAIPQTPRRFNSRHYLNNEDTPDTDGSPPRFKALMAPTPGSRRSPSKGERGRSPTKSRSPTKRY